MRETHRRIAPQADSVAIEEQLPERISQLAEQAADAQATIAAAPSRGDIEELEARWASHEADLREWTATLGERIADLQRELAPLATEQERWERTLVRARAEAVPPELLNHIRSVLADLSGTEAEARNRSVALLTVQNRVAQQLADAADVVDALRLAREQAIDRLLEPDAPPLWADAADERIGPSVAERIDAAADRDLAILDVLWIRRRSAFLPPRCL